VDSPRVTRLVQNWRDPTNPISNTVGSTATNVDFLISAPYADKLPLKVAEMIRKDIPFAILIPLPLLNEIERTGKDSVDEEVRKKRLNMKLVVSTSLGQGWLINHPECRLDKTSHSIFFATCTNQVLQDKGEEIFQSWSHDTLQQTASKITPSQHKASDIDSACLHAIDKLMKNTLKRVYRQNKIFEQTDQSALTPREVRMGKRLKVTESVTEKQGSTEGQTSTTTVPNKEVSSHRQDTTEGPSSDTTASDANKSKCIRTTTHPLHVISTSLPPDPIETWPAKQTLDDIPTGMIRVAQDKVKKGLPNTLIVLKDDKGRERILVPRCQRQRLVTKDVDGARVNYELSRKYIRPNMARDIKTICKACHTCEKSKVRR
jgi:hypothetical protein